MKWLIIGIIMLAVGGYSLFDVIKNPTSDDLPYPSHDLSMKIGSFTCVFLGILLILKSFGN